MDQLVGRLASTAQVKFADMFLEVILGRVSRHDQAAGNFFVRKSVGDQLEHFQRPRR